MRTTPTPDLDRIVTGGQDRLRRRNTTRIGLAAAAVLIAGGGAYGIAQLGDSDSNTDVTDVPPSPVNPRHWADFDGEAADPGAYRIPVGTQADGKSLDADFSIQGSNWTASNLPVAYSGAQFAGFGAYQAESVAGGCKMEAGLKPAATQPQQLVQQLAAMPQSQVLQQPAPATAFGHSATHLQVRVNAACSQAAGPTAYVVAETAEADTRAVSYFADGVPADSGAVVIDFWVLDVNGTTVVVDMFRSEGASQALADQAAEGRESIAFVTE
ncbi:MAG: hypothetical protein J7518_14680 [Nocardioidaceae bacterium]|nr:hypothetical protein [Nocardioidaceae bacterium]